MIAIILSIGDELVLGQTVDTNSAWISSQLARMGCAVAAHMTVGDDQFAIEQAILESVGRCDVLLISGGIGPTDDDLTRQALAAAMGVPLVQDAQAMAALEQFFSRLKRTMPERNRVQALFPRGTRPIDNPRGTAPGIEADYRSGDQKTVCRIFVMPGVPKEMKGMFTDHVLPWIGERSSGAVILSRTLHTFGLGESTVAERLGDLMKRDRNPSVGTTVAGGVVSVRVNARGLGSAAVEQELEATVTACRSALGTYVYGQDEQTLPAVVANLLLEKKKTVASAESCTGGLLAKMLTDIPGSSAYFTHGWVTYSNTAKTELLHVPTEVLVQHGAVSEAVVKAMAEGARRTARSDYALAVSGIAGPDGGTDDKPVGTVCFALASESGTVTRLIRQTGDRDMIRDRSAKTLLTMLRFALLDEPLPI